MRPWWWASAREVLGKAQEAVDQTEPMPFERFLTGWAMSYSLSTAAWGWMGVYPGPDLPGKENAKEAWRAEAEAVRPVCIDPRTPDDLLLESETA